MEKFKIELTNDELEILYRGLLELPGKYAIQVINSIESQVRAQEPKEAKSK